ncbi:kinase [Streptomyces sp. NPDC096132]|uniref:GHMP family kinase ATP-binding protein n=1 Tax=Streptomyces sp. NPDC096132 TaxID=3366075 RepID=UPI003814BF96
MDETVGTAEHPDLGKGRAGVGTAFGTFGELLQGVLYENGLDFLVTFPISRFSTATFRPGSESEEVQVVPAGKHKSRLLASRLLRAFGHHGGGLLEVASDLPVGKGFASSSADLVATARAVADAFGTRLEESRIEALLRDIEPSDGVMYPGVVTYYHKEVRLRERLGFLPPLTVVGLDEGGMVDTVSFNRRVKPFTDADRREYGDLLSTLSQAVRDGDLYTVGAVATRSAEMNAKLLPKSQFEALRVICRKVGGLGLVAAHSGTTLGILLAEEPECGSGLVERTRALCEALPGTVTVYRSLSPDWAGASAASSLSA